MRQKCERCDAVIAHNVQLQKENEELKASLSKAQDKIEYLEDKIIDGAELLVENASLREENEELKAALSYLPKVPTQPYEKEMAKEIVSLREELENKRGAMTLEIHRLMKENEELKATIRDYEHETETIKEMKEVNTSLREELKGYMMGADIEAKAGGEARAEARLLRESLKVAVEALKCAVPYVAIAVPATLYASKNVYTNAAKVKEALAKIKATMGEG